LKEPTNRSHPICKILESQLYIYVVYIISYYVNNMSTGWRKLIGCRKLQVIFHKRATNNRALLRKITYKNKASYGSSPLWSSKFMFIIFLRIFTWSQSNERKHLPIKNITSSMPSAVANCRCSGSTKNSKISARWYCHMVICLKISKVSSLLHFLCDTK